MPTAIQLPAVVLVANANELELAVLASMLLCCTKLMFADAETLVSAKLAGVAMPDAEAVTV